MLLRYSDSTVIRTSLDPFDDVIVWIRAFLAKDYLLELLVEKHRIGQEDAKRRCGGIISHLRLALDHLQLCRTTTAEVGFLPAYYSLLNLAKVYVLCGNYHQELLNPRNRHHGVFYDGLKKSRQNLFTDTVSIGQEGAIPLLYQTLAGQAVSVKSSKGRARRTLRMGEIYSRIIVIQGEAADAGLPSNIIRVRFKLTRKDESTLCWRAKVYNDFDCSDASKARLTKVLAIHHVVTEEQFEGAPFSDASDSELELTKFCARDLLHAPVFSKSCLLPLSGSRLHWFEELPIILLFFHMGSVVRYNPEFLVRLKRSRHWPPVLAAQRHALLRFLLLFVSYMKQQTVIVAPTRT